MSDGAWYLVVIAAISLALLATFGVACIVADTMRIRRRRGR